MGWIFTQSAAERDYIMNSEEVQQMASVQGELGETAVTGVVSVASDDGESEIQFEVPARSCSSCACFSLPRASTNMHMACGSGGLPAASRARQPVTASALTLAAAHQHNTNKHLGVLHLGLDTSSVLAAQAFQVSDQAVRLLQDGWFQPQEQPSGESKLRNPKVPPRASV